MSAKKEYHQRSLEELKSEEKKLKRNDIYAAFGIGFLCSIMLYGWIDSGFGVIYTLIPIWLMYLIFRGSRTNKRSLQSLQEELHNREK